MALISVSSAIITTFVSHTVAALVLMPLIGQIAANTGHEDVYVLSTALMCSASMGLPMSSFPSINAIIKPAMRMAFPIFTSWTSSKLVALCY